MWELTVWDSVVYTALILVLMLLVSKILLVQPPSLNIRDNKNGHRWSLNRFIIEFPLHCNACETFLFTTTGIISTFILISNIEQFSIR